MPTIETFPPIYREHRQTYHADACQPVAEAAASGAIRYEALVRGQYPGRKLSGDDLAGVRNLGFWDIATPQEWGLGWHRNEGIELTFLERGTLGFEVEGVACSIQPGDLTFNRSWQPHRLGDPNVGPSLLHWVILDVGVQRPHQSWQWPGWLVLTPRDRDELTTMLRQAAKPVWHAGEDVLECFRRMARAIASDREGSSISRLTAYLNELFVLLLDLLRQGEVPFDKSFATAQHTVKLFWKEMRQNQSHLEYPWSVEEMAKSCGMGVTQFTHLCRQLANMTPSEYLGHCRVEAARTMLEEARELTITQVGLACGFGSSQYFAKVFRQRIGCSPTEYRMRLKEET